MATQHPRVGNATQDLNRRRLDELETRRRARNLLHPDEVGGGLRPGRTLLTTLGGRPRPITPADLAVFRSNVAKMGPKAREGGISASEALALSLPSRINSTRAEIRYAMLTRLQAGRLDFVTDTGPRSRHTRHLQVVVFSQFAAALARPGTPIQAATWLVKDGLCKLSCSCEDWRFRYSYLATVGGWIESTPQTGYPDERNPMLDGCLCKHLGRVIFDLGASAGIRARIAKMIEAERERMDRPGKTKPRIISIGQAEAEAMLPKRVRRIVIKQRGIAPPVRATADEITRAMRELKARPDSGVLLAALENLLRQRPGAT